MDVNAKLEGRPTDDQKERLENFLTELMLLSRKYRILINDAPEEVEFYDIDSDHFIGVGLAWFTDIADPALVRQYVPVASILDGTWLVDGPDGPAEQMTVQNVFPVREV